LQVEEVFQFHVITHHSESICNILWHFVIHTINSRIFKTSKICEIRILNRGPDTVSVLYAVIEDFSCLHDFAVKNEKIHEKKKKLRQKQSFES